jgi:coenzyme F420 hydrogenase subunit beta
MSGFKIREQMNGVREAPGKTWFWELEAGVIDAGRCIQCGACVAVCPSDSIAVGEQGLPMLAKMCTGCSLCWDFCPRGGLRYESTWRLVDGLGESPSGRGEAPTGAPAPQAANGSNGHGGARVAPWKIAAPAAERNGSEPSRGAARAVDTVRASYSARAREPLAGSQDGGVVSAILLALLEAGEIDGALLARQSERERWKAEPYLATTAEEVRACAGTIYNQTMALGHLTEGLLSRRGLSQEARLAAVGTPCEVQALRAIRARPWHRGSARVDNVTLTIALLCTKSFNYEKLMVELVAAKRGIALEQIGRVDVIRGSLVIQDHDRRTLLEEPIKRFHGAALKGCDECADFLGNAADLSVGSVGSDDGRSTLLVRSAAGERAVALAATRLELRALERPHALDKLDALDKRTAFQTLARPFDPEAPMFIDYREHLEHYAQTDRAPVIHDR